MRIWDQMMVSSSNFQGTSTHYSYSFFGNNGVWSSRWVPMFWKNRLLPSSRQNVQAIGFYEMLVPECQTTLCHTYQKKALLIFTTIRTSTLIFYVISPFSISILKLILHLPLRPYCVQGSELVVFQYCILNVIAFQEKGVKCFGCFCILYWCMRRPRPTQGCM